MLLATKITPVLRYRDPGTAARWLCRAFGFSEHETVHGANGDVTYVLLQLGPNFVLVLPVADLGLDELLVQPQAVGGANTQVCYVTVRDAKAHRAQAERAGAKIEIEPQDDGLGGQFYTCSDLEGHLWSFGTRAYGLADADRQRGADDPGLAQADATVRSGRRSGGRVLARGLALAAAMALTAAGGWVAHRTYVRADTASAARVDGASEQLAQERKRLAAAEDAAKDAEEKLAEQRSTAGEIRRALQQALAELTAERQRKGEAAAALAASKGAATELEKRKLSAQTELAAAREKIAQEEARAKAAAERASALQAQIDKLQQDRAAEREDLNKAKAALQGAQAQLKALREAKAEPNAEPANPPPAAAAATGEKDAENSPASQPPDAARSALPSGGGRQRQGARIARRESGAAQGSLRFGRAGQVEVAGPVGRAPVPRRGDLAGAGQVLRGADARQGELGRRQGVDRAACPELVLGQPQRPPNHRLLYGEGCGRGALADGDPGMPEQLGQRVGAVRRASRAIKQERRSA